MKVLIVDTIHPCLEEMLTEAGFRCQNLSNTSDEEVDRALKDAEGLVLRSRFSLRPDRIDKASKLRFIGRVGAGLEHIDVDHARAKGIEVLSSPEGNRQAVAEHALAMLLALFNRLSKTDREVRKGHWLRKENQGEELEGKTVAIIGFGNTGSAFARVLSGFRVNILAYDKYKSGFASENIQEVDMERVFREAQVVSLHLPMTDETHGLVNASWIERFANPFYLINTARGKIVRTADVLSALDSGAMRGACLDVLEYETENLKMRPLEELPDSARQLAAHPKVLLSPHTAGLTVQSYEKLSSMLAGKIIQRFGHA